MRADVYYCNVTYVCNFITTYIYWRKHLLFWISHWNSFSICFFFLHCYYAKFVVTYNMPVALVQMRFHTLDSQFVVERISFRYTPPGLLFSPLVVYFSCTKKLNLVRKTSVLCLRAPAKVYADKFLSLVNMSHEDKHVFFFEILSLNWFNSTWRYDNRLKQASNKIVTLWNI